MREPVERRSGSTGSGVGVGEWRGSGTAAVVVVVWYGSSATPATASVWCLRWVVGRNSEASGVEARGGAQKRSKKRLPFSTARCSAAQREVAGRAGGSGCFVLPRVVTLSALSLCLGFARGAVHGTAHADAAVQNRIYAPLVLRVRPLAPHRESPL